MEQGVVTAQVVGLAISAGAMALAGWWRIEARIKPSETEIRALREMVLTRYIDQERFEKAEAKLLTAIDRLTDKIEQLGSRLHGTGGRVSIHNHERETRE
jgi:hypothetical protein